MRRAVQIVTLIYNILMPISIVLFGILAALFFFASTQDKIIQELIEKSVFKEDAITPEKVKTFLIVYGVVLIIAAACFVVGLIFNILIRKEASQEFKKDRKGRNIAYGVLAIVFGANVPGILNIIYNATAKEASKENETLE